MAAVSLVFTLLGGVIGAGFASGREILRFFAVHGRAAPIAIACACALMFAIFLRVPSLMRAHDAHTLTWLCQLRLGTRFGLLCGALFMLLFAMTGAAMLAACAELGALVLPIRHAYALSMAVSLAVSCALALCGSWGLVFPGALLCLLLPALLFLLLRLPAGEACFVPSMQARQPILAFFSGIAYAALSAAQVAGILPQLARQNTRARLITSGLFTLLFGVLLSLSTTVCRRHLPAIHHQALPFVWLSRALGTQGYMLVALCLYAASLSTLCAMLRALMQDAQDMRHALMAPLLCLILAAQGFDSLIAKGYPLLGALCAGLLLVLCLPVCPKTDENNDLSARYAQIP